MSSTAENSNQAIFAFMGFVADNSIISTACLIILMSAIVGQLRLRKIADRLSLDDSRKDLFKVVQHIAGDAGMFVFAFVLGVCVFYMGVFFEVHFDMGVAFETISFLPSLLLATLQVIGSFRCSNLIE